MTQILLALLLALAPEPKLGPADDFDEVIAAVEGANAGCRAASFTRHDGDTVRRVLLRCESGLLVLTLAYDRETGWWAIAIEQASCEAPRPGKDI